MDGAFLAGGSELGTHFGARTLGAVEDFRRQTVAMLPLAELAPADSARSSNRHPWASRTYADILEDVPDPIARRYLKVIAHSDMATEPHLTSGLIGLRNFLKSSNGLWRAVFNRRGHGNAAAESGGESGPAPMWSSTLRSCGCRELATTATPSPSAAPDGSCSVSSMRWSSRCRKNRLLEVEWAGERLRRAMARHVAHYDHPGHYLRISILFDRRFWRHLIAGSWVMLDAFGGCCVYDETPSQDGATCGVLGWLLAGADALSSCNLDDRALVARALESLPDALYDEARRRIIEGKVHRWAGAVSGQPGGYPLRDASSAHRPEPVEHPGLVVVGDYLFDSTLERRAPLRANRHRLAARPS